MREDQESKQSETSSAKEVPAEEPREEPTDGLKQEDAPNPEDTDVYADANPETDETSEPESEATRRFK